MKTVSLASLRDGIRQSHPKLRALLAANTAAVIEKSGAVSGFDVERFKTACKRDS